MSLCPVCKKPMVQVEEAQVCAASCAYCRGVWISRLALTRRTNMEINPAAPHVTLPPLTELAETVTSSDSTATLECPICLQQMRKGRFHPKIPVQIDMCDACDYIWLDAGEQGLLLQLYKELVATQQESGATAAGRQANVERMERWRDTSETSPMSRSYSSGMGAEIAGQVIWAIFNIAVDLMLSGGRSSRNRW